MLKIYNTLTRTLEQFEPLVGNKVQMYLCGPTVYDFAHLGHGRSACSFDLIRRYLIYKGYQVTFVSNYTDIDDKMINRANEEKISVKELANKIIPEYINDYTKLNILASDKSPKATEHIETIIKMVENLLENNFAYKLDDGIYFDISKFKEYGKLSNQKIHELKTGARVEEDKNKKNPQDFVLWKSSKEGEPSWSSPFGEGRPGWHIECSAMNLDIFGESFDIHAGGLDLIFPHHECEIAQSESYTNKPFVKYWMHNGFVKVNHEKMSKSLNNFFTLKDIFKKYDPLVVRYFLISTHYRGPIDFSDPLLEQAKNAVRRIYDFEYRLKNYNQIADKDLCPLLENYKTKFENFMDNDFDISGALSVLFDLIKEINSAMDEEKLSNEDKQKIISLVKSFDSVLGLLQNSEEEIPAEIQKLVEERNKFRNEKNWIESDKIRNLLKEKGYEIEDGKNGVKIVRSF